jgi:hypothetical protein
LVWVTGGRAVINVIRHPIIIRITGPTLGERGGVAGVALPVTIGVELSGVDGAWAVVNNIAHVVTIIVFITHVPFAITVEVGKVGREGDIAVVDGVDEAIPIAVGVAGLTEAVTVDVILTGVSGVRTVVDVVGDAIIVAVGWGGAVVTRSATVYAELAGALHAVFALGERAEAVDAACAETVSARLTARTKGARGAA